MNRWRLVIGLVLVGAAGCGGGDGGSQGGPDGAASGSDAARSDAVVSGDSAIRLDAAVQGDNRVADAPVPGTDGAVGQDGATSGSPDGSSTDSAVTSDTATPSTDAAAVACTATPTTTVSAHYLQAQVYESSQTVAYVVPKGFKVTGAVTLPSPPAGGSYKTGSVNIFNLDSGDSYTAVITLASATGFTYTVALPAGTYDVMTRIALQFGAGVNSSIVTRFKFSKLTVCGDATHPIELAAMPALTSKTVEVKGVSAMGTAASPTGYVGFVTLERADHTLSSLAVASAITGDAFSVALMLPADPLVPVISITDAGKATGVRASGMTNGIKLPEAPVAASYSLDLPPLAKLSGTVSDPMSALVQPQVIVPTVTGPSPFSYLHCDSTDRDTFPNPPLFFVESSTGNVMADALSYRSFVRKGVTCDLYGVMAIQLGAGGTATQAGENTIGTLLLPGRNRDKPTVTADLVKDYAVVKPPQEIKLTATIKDSSGAVLPGWSINALARAELKPTGWQDNGLEVFVISDTQGALKANLIPGTYRVKLLPP
jgi:hypothetical protein